jgi:cytochrome c55X
MALLLVSSFAIADEPSYERQQELQQLLHQNCAICHGHSFEGGVGPALTAKVLASKNEQTLITTILDGRPGTAMPPWSTTFKENEVRWLVKFLRNASS